jgi:hypothetical protein
LADAENADCSLHDLFYILQAIKRREGFATECQRLARREISEWRPRHEGFGTLGVIAAFRAISLREFCFFD